MVSAFCRARNVLVRFSNESDFLKSLLREATNVNGTPYRAFQWHPDFVEDEEPSLVPVWIFIAGLPPNLNHEPFLVNITAPIGSLLCRENATRCATRTDGLGYVF